MTILEQLNQHKAELLQNQAQQYELISRYKELIVIIKALELGAKREEELLTRKENSTTNSS